VLAPLRAQLLAFTLFTALLMSASDSSAQAAPQDPSNDRRIDYIEMPATDLAAIKRFYIDAFGWKFTDYGPDYTAYEDGRLTGGFRKADQGGGGGGGGTLVVIYAVDLEGAQRRVESAGAKIVRPIFSFPGGRRFHFTDPSGNELAVWSER
jgi:predicted enzyme related to lactoylglutathione lyase